MARTCALAALLLLVAGCDSPYAFVVGVPEIEPADLHDLVRAEGGVEVLDVRTEEEYRAGHIAGSVSLDLSGVDGYLHRAGPAADSTVVVVCAHGHDSVDAAARARSHGYAEVLSLRGGMDRWRALGLPEEKGEGFRVSGALGRPPQGRTTLLEQLATVVTTFVLKPLYMLLSLVLIVLLWRRREHDLVLAKWAMIAFLFGESACAANYLATMGFSDPLEILHQLGMVGLGTLLPWSFFLVVDRRVLRFSDPESPCAMTRFCRLCFKREDTACGLHRLFVWVTPMLALVALLPLSSPLRPLNVVLPIFDTMVPFWSTPPELIAEMRLYPVLGAACFLAAHLLLRGGPANLKRAQLPFFLGVGFASFGLFRFVLVESFHEMPIWADSWEEITEFLMLVALAAGLFFFRRPMGLARLPDEPHVAEAGG